MMSQYNEYEEYTMSELWDLYFLALERLEKLNAEPVNFYSVGHSETYHSAMSQIWEINGCKEVIEDIRQEINRRQQEEEQHDILTHKE